MNSTMPRPILNRSCPTECVSMYQKKVAFLYAGVSCSTQKSRHFSSQSWGAMKL